MKYAMLLLLVPVLLQAQPFQQETNTIPVEIYGWFPYSAFTKGYSTTAPELCDIDGDGDLDFFLGNGYWNFPFFVNNGNAQTPNFEWQSDNYSGLQSPGLYWNSWPKFQDMDNDGDYDVFISCLSSISRYYENVGSPSSPVFLMIQDTLHDLNGDPVYGMKADLVDIDSDGDYDFFGGRGGGAIYFYRNIGNSASFVFELAEPQFENIDVGTDATPCFADFDGDGDYDLLVGNGDGQMWYYQNNGDSVNWNFQLISSQFDSLDTYERATPAAAKIDGDGDYDLFSGRDPYLNPSSNPLRGDIFFWENVGTPQIADFQYITSEFLTLDEGYFCVGDFADIDADGDVDMLLGSGSDISFFKNVGTTTNPSFLLQTEQFAGLSLGGMGPVFYDLDSDGDLDLANSEGSFTYARVRFYQNIGTPQAPSYQYWFDVNQSGALAENQTIADINGDGDGDLFFTDGWADFYYFENTGTPRSPSFRFITQNFQGISNYDGYPTFVDWDGDGDLDLFLWGNAQNFNYFENVGSATNPQFILTTPNYFGENYGTKVCFVDIDSDSDMDAFFPANPGGVVFLRNLAVSAVPPAVKHPQAGFHLSLGPNPANPVTFITFSLPYPQEATLAVYNLLGARVTTLTSGLQPPGEQSFLWNAARKASGVYIVRLEAAGEIRAGKILVVK